MAVCYDAHGQVRDVYAPYVGLENHLAPQHVHKVGVWVEGVLYWLDGGAFSVSVSYEQGTFVGKVVARHNTLPITLESTDVVYNESNVLVRSMRVVNTGDRPLSCKLCFNQQFHISGMSYGDTAYYSPDMHALLHYKGKRIFLASACDGEGTFFDAYSVGLLGIEGKEGTWRDAEDGLLTNNSIEHGSVDSVLMLACVVPPHGTHTVRYWLIAGERHEEISELHAMVAKKTPEHMIETTRDFWRAWLLRKESPCGVVSGALSQLYDTSLLVVKAHCDKGGASIASLDSSMLQNGRDTYSYCWPRDAAYSVMALIASGHTRAAERFFLFANDILTKDGYLLHKYLPNGALGSSWHSWIRDGKSKPPIQQDETATTLIALGEYYRVVRDVEYIETLYNPYIKRIANFLCTYRDKKTGLPLPSHDLWEERYAVFTYTTASVYGALIQAAYFAEELGKDADAELWRATAMEVKQALHTHLITDSGEIRKSVYVHDGQVSEYDDTVDASAWYGLFRFGVQVVGDEVLSHGRERVGAALTVGEDGVGIARYQGDRYFATTETTVGNPWIITTLWLAEYAIATARTLDDLSGARARLEWVAARTNEAGLLAEQYNPVTYHAASVTPLAWSHAQFVATMHAFEKKQCELGQKK
jgi:GH15 family glucan-1,4-alpha-glucosidase